VAAKPAANVKKTGTLKGKKKWVLNTKDLVIKVCLHHQAKPGQQILFSGSTAMLGAWQSGKRMTNEGDLWTYTFTIVDFLPCDFQYLYIITDAKKQEWEVGPPRKIKVEEKFDGALLIHDIMQDADAQRFFTDQLASLSVPSPLTVKPNEGVSILFRVFAVPDYAQLPSGEVQIIHPTGIAINYGEDNSLDLIQATPAAKKGSWWTLNILVPQAEIPFKYTYSRMISGKRPEEEPLPREFSMDAGVGNDQTTGIITACVCNDGLFRRKPKK
jgi:hypothetical protein